MFLLLYILPLGVRPLLVPDETRYAEIAREMVQSNDYVVPHLNGLRYFEKPVLGYWLNAASLKLFGENEFAVRFSSAASTGLSALFLLLLAGRFAGGSFAGISAALIFLTCFEVFGVGVFSVLDSMLAFFITAGMACFFYAYSIVSGEKGAVWRKTALLGLCGVFWGGAFLTKGFVALAIPVLAIVPFLIWEKNWKAVFRSPWIPLITLVVVVLPWSILIWRREPDFWHYFFWDEHIKRFAGDNAQHEASFFYFFMLFPLAAIPWTFLAPAAWKGIKKNIEKPVIKFAICWFIFPFLFFSLSKGKLLTYILPCFVPFALLLAGGLDGRKDSKIVTDFKTGALPAIAFFSILALGLLIFQVTDFHNLKPYANGTYWIVVLSLLTCSLIMGIAIVSSGMRKKIILFAVAPMIFMFCANFAYPDKVILHQAPGSFLLKHADKIHPDTVLVSGLTPARAVCWYYKRNDVYLIGDAGELSYGLRYDDASHRQLDIKTLNALIRQNQGRVVLVAEADHFKKWRPVLPSPQFIDQNGEYVFSIF